MALKQKAGVFRKDVLIVVWQLKIMSKTLILYPNPIRTGTTYRAKFDYYYNSDAYVII